MGLCLLGGSDVTPGTSSLPAVLSLTSRGRCYGRGRPMPGLIGREIEEAVAVGSAI